MLNGGFLPGDAVMVAGAAGTGVLRVAASAQKVNEIVVRNWASVGVTA